MYLISLYFEQNTTNRINQYIKQVAKKSKNTYMLDANIPPHMTISAFETCCLNEVTVCLENSISKLSQGNVQFVGAGVFFPYVLYLQPVLNRYLHSLSVTIYESLFSITDTYIQKYYQPLQWLPHTTIGKKLSRTEMLTAFSVLQDSFGLFEGTVTQIGLSKTKPYTDIMVWNLKNN